MSTCEPRERVIAALDVTSADKAFRLVELLHDYVGGFKLGLELTVNMLADLLTTDLEAAKKNLEKYHALMRLIGPKAFIDWKFHDIENTVKGAMTAGMRFTPRLINLHCSNGIATMAAAKQAAVAKLLELGADPSKTRLLGVSVLTNLNYQALADIGLRMKLSPEETAACGDTRIKELVANLAAAAQTAGLDGVIGSAQEVPIIRERCGRNFHLVTPAIRPLWSLGPKDDQKRAVTPEKAIKLGTDEMVIGRPLTNPPENIGGPVEAAKRVLDEIASAA